MKLSAHLLKFAFALFVLLWAFALTARADDEGPIVTRYFSGVWDQVEQEAQGLFLQIVEQPDGSKEGVVYWYTYDGDLKSAWYVGVGAVEGNQVLLTLYTAFGVDFMQPESPVEADVMEIGTMTLTFHNCNKGTAVFDTSLEEVGSGEFPIRRLTKLYHSRCSGGISDDTPSDVKPTVLQVHLWPVRDDISGHGKAKFKEQADRMEFSVEAEDAPDGLYQLEVCGENRGELEVVAGEGEIEYRSPEEDGAILLTFDPRDCPIDLLDEAGVALSTGDAVLGDKNAGHGKPGHGNPGHGGGGGDDGEEGIEIKVELSNTGVLAGAEGKAKLEIESDHTEFEVEIENVSEGLYPVHVDGLEVGVIEAVLQGNDSAEGEIEFRDPEEPGTPLLDFDPRGMTIEVYQGDSVILDAFFPDS